MWEKLTATEGRRGLLDGQSAVDLCVVAFGSPLGRNQSCSVSGPKNFMDVDTTFTLNNYREIIEKPIYFALLQRSLFVSGYGHFRDRHLGVSSGIFCVVPRAGAPQILVAVPDYNPILDQLSDPRFPCGRSFWAITAW